MTVWSGGHNATNKSGDFKMVDSNQVPLMFRAQIEHRCQIQRLIPKLPKQSQQQAYRWVDEWIKAVEKKVPQFSSDVRTKEYQISWRFVTNSGQDEGVIRPVIGAMGFPFYPGASMKGVFLRCCTPKEAMKYCGGKLGKEIQPGILRFHGGYPKDLSWLEQELVDIVHPQQDWQVKNKAAHSACIQISLYQPTLVFGISSPKPLLENEWERIWEIWEQALDRGIGCRVSAGYGQPKKQKANTLISIDLQGQGLASQLVNKEGEFRPNMFKASLRGHCMRFFAGVTDETTAERLTKELWGGFAEKDGAIVGELGIGFEAINLSMDVFTYTPNINNRNSISMPTYNLTDGRLEILCTQKLSEEKKEHLTKFVTGLLKAALLLGGFGKSWRRVDHRLIYFQYFENNDKPLIGCHWKCIRSYQKFYVKVDKQDLSDITNFLNNFHNLTSNFVVSRQYQTCQNNGIWREAFHPNNVQVWGRIAEDIEDSEAVDWFHGNYRFNTTIKKSSLTGQMGQIGRIWHRMYPRFVLKDKKIIKTTEYVELLTIFPDKEQSTTDFLKFLENTSSFSKLWGN